MKLGIAGAVWATIVSICFSSGYLFYWFFIKRDSYVDIKLRGFRFRRTILVEILKVGAPASFQQMTMSIFMLILNMIAVKAGGTDAVAIFTTGWRVVMFATLPLLGMATAVVSVTGAAYGGRDYNKLDNGYMYAIRIGIIVELVMAVVTFIRTILLTAPLTYILAITLGMQLDGLWWGIVIGNSLGATIAFTWGRQYVHRLQATYPLKATTS